MLLRNFTKVTLKIGYGKDKIVLPPMTIVNVNECKYPAEYIKKHYGSYVQILTEKQEETTDERADIPAKVKEDMAKQEAVGDVSTVNEAGAKEDEKGDDKGAPKMPQLATTLLTNSKAHLRKQTKMKKQMQRQTTPSQMRNQLRKLERNKPRRNKEL